MSAQGDIQSFLTTMAGGTPGKVVTITPETIAIQTGFTRDKVNKTLHNLMTRKRIALTRGENGRSITGYKLLEAPADKRRAGAAAKPGRPAQPASSTNGRNAPPAAPKRRQVYTPKLDAYVAQRARFERLTSELGDRVEATFKEDPLAEEGLLLKERLGIVEDQLHEYRERAEEAEREVKALRTRHVQATTRKAVEAGAMVVHSDD